jgi:hypothetical protein
MACVCRGGRACVRKYVRARTRVCACVCARARVSVHYSWQSVRAAGMRLPRHCVREHCCPDRTTLLVSLRVVLFPLRSSLHARTAGGSPFTRSHAHEKDGDSSKGAVTGRNMSGNGQLSLLSRPSPASMVPAGTIRTGTRPSVGACSSSDGLCNRVNSC